MKASTQLLSEREGKVLLVEDEDTYKINLFNFDFYCHDHNFNVQGIFIRIQVNLQLYI